MRTVNSAASPGPSVRVAEVPRTVPRCEVSAVSIAAHSSATVRSVTRDVSPESCRATPSSGVLPVLVMFTRASTVSPGFTASGESARRSSVRDARASGSGDGAGSDGSPGAVSATFVGGCWPVTRHAAVARWASAPAGTRAAHRIEYSATMTKRARQTRRVTDRSMEPL